ncbi:MAG: hypothetical protein ACT4QC_05590, partial [Planctomycetaceae bacterium]
GTHPSGWYGDGPPVGNDSSPSGLTNVNGTLFFFAYDGSALKLWRSGISIDETKVVPTNAIFPPEAVSHLNVNQVWGGEQLTVPVTVSNLTGDLKVTIYLSTTPDLTPATPPLAASPLALTTNPTKPDGQQQKFTGNGTANQVLQVYVTVTTSSSAVAGKKYYLVAKVESSNGVNIGATDHKFEYVGTQSPTYQMKIKSDQSHPNPTYFNILRDTISGVDPFTTLLGKPLPVDGKQYTAYLEGIRFDPYLDTKGIPTIGVGINLNTVSGTIATNLANAVKAFYAAKVAAKVPGYTDISKYSTSQVISLLKSQAGVASKTEKRALDAITEQDALNLFETAYNNATASAISYVGAATWNALTEKARIVLIDLAYNVGKGVAGTGITGFDKMLAALQSPDGPDYLRAGFELLNSKRSALDIGYARSLANYKYLLDGVSLTSLT